MATIETNPQLGAQIVADAKEYVLHSWSVQDAINPIPVAGAEGRYFWDYDGKRYLDFASQLVNVSIGHQHPKLIAAIKEQADQLCTIGPPMATESRSQLGRMLAEVTPGRPEDVVLHERRRRGERERDQARALVHRPPQGDRPLPLLPRRDRAARSRSPAIRAAGTPSRASRASCACSTRTPTAARPGIPIRAPSARGAPHLEEILQYEGAAHRRRRDPRDRRRHERRHRPAGRLPAVDPRDVRPARDPADPATR